MRVALMIYSLELGGAERAMRGLADHFAAAGHQVTLVTVHPADTDWYSIGPRVRRVELGAPGSRAGLAGRIAANVARARRLRRVLLELEPDVAVSFIDRMNVIALLACLGTSIPLIVSERIDPRHHPVDVVTRALRTVLYPCAAAVVVQTKGVETWARKRGVRRVLVIPNWVVPSNVPPEEIGPASRVISIGRLCPQKGFDLLIPAFVKATADRPGWTLTIFGEGDERADLTELVHELGAQGRVALPGPTSRPEAELARAGVFALSSRYEGFPNVLLEAMAAGTPPVSFDCDSGPAEIIRPGIDGLLVAPGDVEGLAAALSQLMDDPALRYRLGHAARDVTDRFGEASVGAQWDELLASVARRRGA
jgi:GalNAc-alpha-(1->4)-GalNAc-alpha-(1->3)-diNAcBac-PP-undecaprenol alpha-1,4-N-acetyl-D-galactosaminyltransferase